MVVMDKSPLSLTENETVPLFQVHSRSQKISRQMPSDSLFQIFRPSQDRPYMGAFIYDDSEARPMESAQAVRSRTLSREVLRPL